MNLKKKLQRISSWFTPINSWTGQIIKLSIVGIALILIICLWVFFLKYLLNQTSVNQLYIGAFYVIFYLFIWGILPALGIRMLVKMMKHYSSKI